MNNIIRPGRQVANGIQSNVSPGFLKQILRKASPETLTERLEAIFQPERKVQEVMVPYFNEFLNLIAGAEPVIYKGVSFNPFVATFGENANLLDFYSWIKRSNLKGVILDASLYAVVNASKEPLVKIFSQKAASEAVEFLKDNIQQFPEIRKAADTRERYLRSAPVSLFPPRESPLVISAEELWQRESYRACLQKAIEFCSEGIDGQPLEIKKYAMYNRYDQQYQRWYTALVLAEALYLNEVYGANIKLGPTSESNFDALINKFMQQQGKPFAFVWYNRNIENDIPYADRLFFQDDVKTIERKLGNPALAEWVREIISPFQPGEDLTASKVYELLNKVNQTAQRQLPRLDAEGEWFMTFPPGECD